MVGFYWYLKDVLIFEVVMSHSRHWKLLCLLIGQSTLTVAPQPQPISAGRSSVDRILDGPKMPRASHFSLLPGTTTESKTCETCEKMGLWGSGLLLQRIYKSKLLVVVSAMTPPDAVRYGILWQNIKRLMLHLLHKLFCDFLCWRSAVSAICVKI